MRLAAVLSALLLLSGLGTRAQEPEYDGKPLDHWVKELRAGKAASARAAFAAMGPRAAPAVPALLELLGDREAGPQAAECLGLIGKPAVPALLKALDSESEAVRGNAAEALRFMEPDAAKEAGARLLRAFRSDGCRAVREAAGMALGTMRFEPDRVVPGIVDTVKEGLSREGFVEAFVSLNAYGGAAAPWVFAALDKAESPEAWADLCLAIEGIPDAAADMVPGLIRILRRERLDIEDGMSEHYPVVKALASYGPAATQALLPLLSDERAEMRWRALRVLGRMGEDAAPALGAAQEAARAPDPRMRKAAAAVLAEIGIAGKKPEAFRALLDLLHNDKSASVRAEAALSLAGMVPAAFRAEAVTALCGAGEDPDEGVREAALLAIGGLGERTPKTTETLVRGLADKAEGVRAAAANSVGDLRLAEAVPALVKIIEDEGDSLRGIAIWTLGRIGPGAKGALPALRQVAEKMAPWDGNVRAVIARIEQK